MSWLEVLVTSVWGGLMALERRAFLQAMVSRPLIAAAATGLLLDDLVAGLAVGVVFELLHLGGVSLGGAHPDHDTLPAIAASALAAGLGHADGSHSTPAMWSVAILACAPFGPAGTRLENRLDRRANKYFGRAVTATSSGDLGRAARQNLRAMWPQFVFYGLICGAAAFAGPRLELAVTRLPLEVLRGLAFAYPAMGVAAAAAAVHGTKAPRSALIGLGVLVLGLVGLVATGRWG